MQLIVIQLAYLIINCDLWSFSGTGVCADVLNNCPEYTLSSCQDPYVDWAKKNCAQYCGYCGLFITFSFSLTLS